MRPQRRMRVIAVWQHAKPVAVRLPRCFHRQIRPRKHVRAGIALVKKRHTCVHAYHAGRLRVGQGQHCDTAQLACQLDGLLVVHVNCHKAKAVVVVARQNGLRHLGKHYAGGARQHQHQRLPRRKPVHARHQPHVIQFNSNHRAQRKRVLALQQVGQLQLISPAVGQAG